MELKLSGNYRTFACGKFNGYEHSFPFKIVVVVVRDTCRNTPILVPKAIYNPPSLPRINASTISPLPMEFLPTSLELGRHNNPLAPVKLPTFELRCPPVLTAVNPPVSVTEMNTR